MCECRETREWKEVGSKSADALVFHYFCALLVRACEFSSLSLIHLHIPSLYSNTLAAHQPTFASQPPRALVSSRRTRVCRPFSVVSTFPSTFSCALKRSAPHSRPPARVRLSWSLLLRPMLLVAVLLLLVLPPLLPPLSCPPLFRPHRRRPLQRPLWRTRLKAVRCDSARRVRCASRWTRVRTTRSCCSRSPLGMVDTLVSVCLSLSLCMSLYLYLSLFMCVLCFSVSLHISLTPYTLRLRIAWVFLLFLYQDCR
jgi:hypothetical protein